MHPEQLTDTLLATQDMVDSSHDSVSGEGKLYISDTIGAFGDRWVVLSCTSIEGSTVTQRLERRAHNPEDVDATPISATPLCPSSSVGRAYGF